MRLTFLLFSFILFTCSCKKENDVSDAKVAGDWVWQRSYGSDAQNSFEAKPDSNSATLISFYSDHSFINKSACLLPGPNAGTYEIKTLNFSGTGAEFIILRSQNIRDTFRLFLGNQQMTLSEIHPTPYFINHEFEKR